MLDKEEMQYQAIITDILHEAKKSGMDAAEVAIASHVGLSASVRLGETDSVEFSRSKALAMTVYQGKKKGSVSTTDIQPEAIRAALKAAIHIAEYTEEDPFSGLADKAMLAKDIPDLDLYHPADISAEKALMLAKECETSARDMDAKIINSEGATFSTHQSHRVYGNSLGFLAGYKASQYSLSCTVIAKENEGMQRDYDFTIGRAETDLLAPALVGKNAALRTVQRLNARKIKTGMASVIFSPEMARGLWGHLLSAISGGQLYRRASFLVDHLGKQIFPNFVHLQELPHLRKGLGSAPFDNEGVQTTSRDIIQDGVLQGYVLGSYSARKLGLKTTGNAGGVHNVIVTPGQASLQDLCQEMQEGLLVTELMGHGINLVTGDYSRGAAGFWIEGGVIQYPVHEITIAGNLKDLFKQLIAVGNDVDRRSSIITGSVWVGNMMIGGT
jgi:PmbA protein